MWSSINLCPWKGFFIKTEYYLMCVNASSSAPLLMALCSRAESLKRSKRGVCTAKSKKNWDVDGSHRGHCVWSKKQYATTQYIFIMTFIFNPNSQILAFLQVLSLKAQVLFLLGSGNEFVPSLSFGLKLHKNCPIEEPKLFLSPEHASSNSFSVDTSTLANWLIALQHWTQLSQDSPCPYY